jgi:hypothetical protein
MKQILQNSSNGQTELAEVPCLQAKSGQLLITSLFPEQIAVHADTDCWEGRFPTSEQGSYIHCEPHFGWHGHHIE